MFPSGYFYLICRKNGYALDVYDGSTKTGANIIIWPQKFADSDNQLWSYDKGRLVNKKSGHVIDIQSGAFKKDKTIVQNKHKDKNQTQEWGFDNGFIFSIVYPTMVLEIKSEDGGAQVLLTRKKNADNLSQKWFIEPYHQFEASLTMAADVNPLHKRANFGQPSLGYGAEVGTPPELTALPPNINVVGVNGVTPKPTVYISPSAYNMGSQKPETLAPSNSYSASQTSTLAQPGYQTTTVSSAQQQQPSTYGAGSAYPPSGGGGYPPSNPHSSTGYPPSNPNSSTGYPPSNPHSSTGYPPSNPHSSTGYPPSNLPPVSTGAGYPPAGAGAAPGYGNGPPPQSPSGGYQAYSPTFSNATSHGGGYPAYSSSPPSYGGGGYPPQTQAGFPSPPPKHNTNVFPPSAGPGGYSSPSKPNPPAAYPPGPNYTGGQPFPHQLSGVYPPASPSNSSGYPPQQPGGGYPQQQPVGGFFAPPPLPQRQQSGMQMPGSGYPPAGYPPYPPS